MKRACIKLNTNMDEQSASAIRPLKINFVWMKNNGILVVYLNIVSSQVKQEWIESKKNENEMFDCGR
jgi:hypothetical protein